MNVLIVVTHLLGTGHLSRALTLARAFSAAGHGVTVASGGMPARQLDTGNIDLIQLPPLRSDGVNFTRLLDEAGNEATAEYYAARQAQLGHALYQIQPDVLITELYPFGRRSLRDEFTQLLRKAQAFPMPPLVLSSIRDILAPPSKPAKAQFADDVIAQFYDGVLVHSDPAITPLELSWPVNDTTAAKLQYTGFVTPPAPKKTTDNMGTGEVLISAGGGDVGTRLFETAKHAARNDPDRTWRILVGGQNPEKRVDLLRADAPHNLVVETARSDFRSMLFNAAASVSMCGYNTALDVLQTRVPAVFVPFDAGGEVEQSLRAKALAKQEGISVLTDQDLGADTLLQAVKEVLNAAVRSRPDSGFNGANMTVTIVEKMSATKGIK
jgi:predicted glycosyltransferase